MTFADTSYRLPDPATDPQFYEGTLVSRAVAWVIDGFFIGIIAAILVFTIGVGTFGLGFLLAPIIGLGTAFAYRFGTIAMSSRTPGMGLMGLEFRGLDGQRFDRTEAFVHTALYMVVFISVVGQVLSCLIAVMTPRHQTIADLVTGSTAINRPL